mgnify:CR=1 FL=1
MKSTVTLLVTGVLTLFCSFSLILYVQYVSAAEEPSKMRSPEELLQALTAEIKQGTSADHEILIKEIVAHGQDALPAISNSIKKGDKSVNAILLNVLSQIPSESSNRLLIRFASDPSDGELRRMALGKLENRRIEFPLSKSEFDVLSGVIETDNILLSGAAARLLGKCTKNDVADRIQPILRRFKKEVNTPSDISTIAGSYLSPRAYILNQFLLSFSYLGEAALPALQEASQTSRDKNLNKWLKLARGYAGDESVTQEIRDIFDKEEDKSIKCLAIRSYARSAKKSGIPFLSSLLADKTVSDYGDCTKDIGMPIYIFRNVAKDEMQMLQE